MSRQLRSGADWRVGWNPEPVIFQALLGADDWAVELTKDEFKDFCQFAQQLSETVAQMQAELMQEETIVCEAASELIRLEVSGHPSAYELSFTILTGRRAEGRWPAAVAQEILRAVQIMQVF